MTKIPPTDKWTPIQVEWEDAHGGDLGWGEATDSHHSPERVVSIGLLVKLDKAGLTMTMSRLPDRDDDTVGGYLFIPRANITAFDALYC